MYHSNEFLNWSVNRTISFRESKTTTSKAKSKVKAAFLNSDGKVYQINRLEHKTILEHFPDWRQANITRRHTRPPKPLCPLCKPRIEDGVCRLLFSVITSSSAQVSEFQVTSIVLHLGYDLHQYFWDFWIMKLPSNTLGPDSSRL